jgi:translation initiation factor 3 subunit M
MATYIDFSSEEEQANTLAQFLNAARPTADDSFVDTCAKLASENKFAELWSKLLAESPVLFGETPEKDVEGFFFAVVSLLNRLGPDSIGQTLPSLFGAITSSTEKPMLRLRILGSIYNILTSATHRYQIFSRIISYAASSKHPEVVFPHFKDIDQKVSDWGIDEKQTQDLYKQIRDLYKQSNKSPEAQKWTIKYLTNIKGSADEVASEAANAVLEAIRTPDLYQFDGLLDVVAIKQLEKDAKHARLHQLLSIYVSESLDSFKAFTTTNAGYLQQLGLDEGQCTHKMKLLSLATLAAANPEISYASIAKALQIKENEVEGWVISAISEGVIEAKMDQLKSTVRVTRSLQRIFTRAQWKQLSENLEAWKKNVHTLLQTLQDCKQQTQLQASELTQREDVTQI